MKHVPVRAYKVLVHVVAFPLGTTEVPRLYGSFIQELSKSLHTIRIVLLDDAS